MNKQIERILLGMLWLLAATLGTTFWLNTIFGFNIFSSQHWAYLSYLQAARTPVRPAFYASLVAAILITIAGLYITTCATGADKSSGSDRRAWIGRLRDKLRVRANKRAVKSQPARPAPPPAVDVPPAVNAQPAVNIPPAQSYDDASTIDIIATESPAPAEFTSQPISMPPAAPRPPRLNITRPASGAVAPQPKPATSSSAQDYDELRKIFEDAGYVIKNAPRFGNYKPALMAIGTGENIWIGGINTTAAQIQGAMTKLSEVFNDTLEDIEILIHGFVVHPTEPISGDDVLSFDSMSALREYMNEHTNPAVPPNEKGDFDAYSEYIDTVIKFVGTI